jgi:8-oxo-dGTP diphosphatase
MGKAEQGVESSGGRYTVIPRVLVFVFSGTDVLLLKGAPTKRLWANRYNGLGGHVEADEDVYSAARREVLEEAGLAVHDLRLCGVVNVDTGPTASGRRIGITFFVFSAACDTRATRASAEGTLEWVPLDRIYAYALVEDLPALLQRVQADASEVFFARYWYDDEDRLRIDFAEQ